MSRNRRNFDQKEKSNIIQIVAIIVSAVVVLIAAFIGVFSDDIHDKILGVSETTTVLDSKSDDNNYTKDKLIENKDSPSDPSDNTKDVDASFASLTSHSDNNVSAINTKQTIPDISLGNKITSIELVDIESNNVFFKSNSSITTEPFYNGIERSFKATPAEGNGYTIFSAEGYGVYCLIPLNEMGKLGFNSSLCDKNKTEVCYDEANMKYSFNTHIMHRDEAKTLILCFTFDKPLSKGTYYAKFYIVDYNTNKHDDVYLKFKIT